MISSQDLVNMRAVTVRGVIVTVRSIDWFSPVSSLVVQLRPPLWDQSRGDRGGPVMLPWSLGSQVMESPEI